MDCGKNNWTNREKLWVVLVGQKATTTIRDSMWSKKKQFHSDCKEKFIDKS